MGTTFTAIDFETATRDRASACALGICVFEDGVLTDKSHFLIKPEGNVFERRCIRIHGITPAMTENAPTFDQIYPSLLKIFQSAPLVHYSSFDKSVLEALIRRYHLLRFVDFKYVDVCKVARQNFPTLKDHKLPTVVKHLGLGDFKHHNAADDALKCGEIYLRLCDVNSNPCDAVTQKANQCKCDEVDMGDAFNTAFPMYIDSILADGIVDYKEAYELLCILRAFSIPNPLFKELVEMLESVTSDGMVTSIESSRLKDALTGLTELLRHENFIACRVCQYPIPNDVRNIQMTDDEYYCPWCGAEIVPHKPTLDDEFDMIFGKNL